MRATAGTAGERGAGTPAARRGGLALFVERYGRWLIILPPLLFLVVFFLIPFGFALKISFAEAALRIPPFSDVFSVTPDHRWHLSLSLANYKYLLTDEVYAVSYLYSIRTAFFSTLCCLLIGYPMAYAMARASKATQSILMLVIILPFWTSFLLRVYALEGIIRDQGLLNTALLWLGVIDHPLKIMRTTFAVYLGIVYSYLPFMVLPIYASFEKMDSSLVEAAIDLGCTPTKAFWVITAPIARPGIIAGCLLVFIPAVGEFVIPDLLGGSETLMIGRTLWVEFFNNRDWPLASTVAIVLLFVLVLPMMLFQRQQAKAAEGGGT